VIHPETVLEAGMVGGGIDEIHSPELADVAEALDCGGVEEVPRDARDLDVVVDAVLDRLHWDGFRRVR
jgi:hypothetical protein